MSMFENYCSERVHCNRVDIRISQFAFRRLIYDSKKPLFMHYACWAGHMCAMNLMDYFDHFITLYTIHHFLYTLSVSFKFIKYYLIIFAIQLLWLSARTKKMIPHATYRRIFGADSIYAFSWIMELEWPYTHSTVSFMPKSTSLIRAATIGLLNLKKKLNILSSASQQSIYVYFIYIYVHVHVYCLQYIILKLYVYLSRINVVLRHFLSHSHIVCLSV